MDRAGFYRQVEAEEARRLREEWTVEDDRVKWLRDEWEAELACSSSSSDEEEDDDASEEEKVPQEAVARAAEAGRQMEGNRMMYGGLPARGRVEARLIKTVYVEA